MRLPQSESAFVPREKILDYLLSASHPRGRHKATFFTAFGFLPENWETLADAILQHAAEHDVVKAEATNFGTRFVVECIMETPDGRFPCVRTAWFVEEGEEIPRFVTAHPLRKGRSC